MKLKVTFLGTGTSQGVPLIGCACDVCLSTDPRDKRLRSSVLVESETTRIVIDTGPDFRQQLLRLGINHLDAVLFTHEHKDHIAGLDEIRAFNFISRKRMPVYATQRVQQALKREFAYIFSEEKYPGIPEIDLHTFEDDTFTIGDLVIEPLNVMHYKLQVKGFRINSFAYVTDANFIADPVKARMKDLRVLVLNALRREKHISHFTFEQAVALSKELGPAKTYFTHISHQLATHQQLDAELPENIEAASDNLQIVLA
jgi:phosphoribosyl 1,2-cyclic phosphate phosphodiesterase